MRLIRRANDRMLGHQQRIAGGALPTTLWEETEKGGPVMKGLIIKNKTHWCDAWSAQLGTRLTIRDGSYNLLIFHQRHGKEEILANLPDAPQHLFEIVDLKKGREGDCDLVSDSGLYYKIVH